MQVEIVAELALNPPQPVLGTIRHFTQLRRAGPVETAADQVRKDQIGWIGAVGAGVAGKPQPEVKVGVKTGVGQVDAGDFVEEHTSVNHPLESGVAARPQLKYSPRGNLGGIRVRHRHELDWS